jgi:hypothetical protein
MIWQGFALGLARLLVVGCVSAWGAVRSSALQGFELSLQARMVGGEALFKEAALLSVHAPCSAPDAETVMHEEPDARGPRVGEEVAVVGLRRAEDLHDAGQQPVDTGAHADGSTARQTASILITAAARSARPRTAGRLHWAS